ELVGLASNDLFLGKHSGRHAFNDKVKLMGYDLTEEKSKEAFKRFKLLTDRKKEVTDDDLLSILTEVQTTTSAVEKYVVKTLQVQHGTNSIRTRTVVVKTNDN